LTPIVANIFKQMPVQTGGIKRFTPRRENTLLTRENLVRRLTAIFAADVAGYSRLTGMDEEGTHVRLKEHLRVLIDPKVAAHRGHIVKNTGDGFLAEFNSVVDAMRCAVDVQRGMAERNSDVPPNNRIEFRIGINVGDIIEDNGDIFGDGVNVAARLETIAEPGGICVSDDAHRQLRDKLDIVFDDVGEQNLKNIGRPIRVFRVRDRGAAASGRMTGRAPVAPPVRPPVIDPVIGPTVKNYLSNYLARRFVPTMMGFDPLWQLLHEADAVAAFRLAILRDVPGTFNIVGDGVLPLTTIIKLAGRVATPVMLVSLIASTVAVALVVAAWPARRAARLPPPGA
jgi:class 3 adenylate cyclase